MSRAPSPAKRPGWHWSEYWSSGRVEVMTVDTADGGPPYDTTSLWRDFFQTLEPGARVIDLATGGGHVARIAAAAGRSFEVVGVDYADLGPHAGAAPQGLTLQGGVALEKLPFPPAAFDAATSQFGIEYAEPRAALAELARVLRPGGRALLLVHHAGSAICRSAAEQVAAFDKVVGEGAAVRQARRVFAAHARRAPADALRSAEATFREAVQRMAGRLTDDPAFAQAAGFVGYLDDLARNAARFEPTSALARLEHAETVNAAWRQRLRGQLAAALDEAGVERFLQRAERAGLERVARQEEHDARGAVIAWRLGLRRA